MLKKFLLSALIALSTFGIFSTSEAHHGHYYYGDCHEDGDYCGGHGCR